MKVTALQGDALVAALPEVAALRINVFRDWPYLYDGDLAYETEYLKPYANSPQAIIVGAYDGDQLVGASTGAPLLDHADDFGAAFQNTVYNLKDVFYFAESVLLPQYRGQGIGHQFFDLREAHARSMGFTYVTFCGVLRPSDHPSRPATYRPLDDFWRGRGYAPLDGVVAEFGWKDVGDADETRKPLQFWMRHL